MRIDAVAFWGGTSLLFLAIAVTGNLTLLGALLGYWLGFLNSVWLYRDTLRSIGLTMIAAQKRLRRGFFARLGVITTVVIAIYRFRNDWLVSLVIGLAVGLFLSLFVIYRRQIFGGKG